MTIQCSLGIFYLNYNLSLNLCTLQSLSKMSIIYVNIMCQTQCHAITNKVKSRRLSNFNKIYFKVQDNIAELFIE